MAQHDCLRPRLAPTAVLLERPDHDLQIGLGPTAVLLADPDGDWRRLLVGCQGTATIDDLARPSPLPRPLVDATIGELAARGLVEVGPGRARSLRARVMGAGALGAAVARVLPGLGFGTVYVCDPATPDADRYPHTHARRQSEALCDLLDARTFRSVTHWTKPAGVEVSLTVIASATIEADRGLADELVRGDQPHLIVRPLPGGAVVGPLVLPGRTACLRCCDLHQRDLDPDWPGLLQQLLREPATVDPVTCGWAVAVAAVQVRGLLARQRVDTESGTLELTSADSRQVWRSWRPHPECSCHW